MKTYFLIVLLTLFTCHSLSAQDNVIELDGVQSMCITGKGPGQDGALNPYAGQDCIAVVENLSKNTFSVRIERDGELVAELPIKANEKKEVRLMKGSVLYFDSKLKTKVKVDFKRIAY